LTSENENYRVEAAKEAEAAEKRRALLAELSAEKSSMATTIEHLNGQIAQQSAALSQCRDDITEKEKRIVHFKEDAEVQSRDAAKLKVRTLLE